MAGVAMAQDISITSAHDVYVPGETVELQYQGTAAGDKILLYQNLAVMPLKESASLTTMNGVYHTASALEPGHYSACVIRNESDTLAMTQFEVAPNQIPVGGKKIFLLSDTHVMSPELVDNPEGSSYVRAMADNRKLQAYSAEIFDAVIDSILDLRPDLVIIPGDMTKDGELLSHQYVAERLHLLLDQGIKTVVIPGNHDMECGVGRHYTEDSSVAAENVSIAKFQEIYYDFGWRNASDCDPNSLSYACEPIQGMKLVCIDDCKTYSRGWKGEVDGEYGCIPDATLQWVLGHVDQAVSEKKVPVVVIHHQMLTHFNKQDEFMASASLDQGDSIARVFLEHGVRLVLTGHMHIPDISKIWNENRTDSLIEITSGSPISYPCQYRILSVDDDLTTMTVETRFITRTASLEDVQRASREQIRGTLRSSIRKLVRRYLPMLTRLVNDYSNIDPALKVVLEDIPLNTESLTSVAMDAFRPVMEKVIFTHSEGNENLKLAEDQLMAEFYEGCKHACDLVFDNQDEDTRAFMLTLMETQMESRGIDNILRSMLSDRAYMGLPDESQDNDLYYTIRLKPSDMAVKPIIVDGGEEMIYNVSGQKMNSRKQLPKGLYLIRKDGTTKKVLMD